MQKSKNKLTTKELIQAGGFGAIFIVLILVVITVTSIIPVLFIFEGVINGIVLGTIYILYVTKVPKRGAIMILAIFVGLISSTTFIYPFFISIVLGLFAELIAWSGQYKSSTKYILSYGVFSCMFNGAFITIVIARDDFLKAILNNYGRSYAYTLSSILSNGTVIVMVAATFVAGIIGGFIGKKLLKKHFERAGIV